MHGCILQSTAYAATVYYATRTCILFHPCLIFFPLQEPKSAVFFAVIARVRLSRYMQMYQLCSNSTLHFLGDRFCARNQGTLLLGDLKATLPLART